MSMYEGSTAHLTDISWEGGGGVGRDAEGNTPSAVCMDIGSHLNLTMMHNYNVPIKV